MQSPSYSLPSNIERQDAAKKYVCKTKQKNVCWWKVHTVSFMEATAQCFGAREGSVQAEQRAGKGAYRPSREQFHVWLLSSLVRELWKATVSSDSLFQDVRVMVF